MDAVFDASALLERACGDVDLMTELVQLFLSESPGLLDKLEGALKDSDTERVIDAVHKLRGSLLNLSAGAASAAALDIEKKAHQGQLEQISIDGLKSELAALREALFSTGYPARNV
jgi:HPt (histidine-containing phosphotransfer) domain-containing protein